MGKVVCFGEVLWDVLPTGKKVGGAPLNVALRLNSLGNESYVISSVGDDVLGEELMNEIKPFGVNLNYLQKNKDLDTSEVLVVLDSAGSASYDIKYPCAWDAIACNDETLKLVSEADAFLFGSLVARDPRSKGSLLKLMDVAKYKIFDVNLRAPHYSKELLTTFMEKADFIKFNDEELNEICAYYGHEDIHLEESVRLISEKTRTKHICVTLGADGAALFYNDKFYYNKGYKITVADTVGSGDSFLASIVSELMRNVDPQEAIDFACAVGALVATFSGANPVIANEKIEALMHS
ncbi:MULTISPECIES: carbohydrate kinase family protein [unclassified Saccharicrinis]|uniref:carbohydrate kinase family protein n=1 Tax=unclassified Saccharicrinis TaxID=2646859 RepID=UPI003D356BA3